MPQHVASITRLCLVPPQCTPSLRVMAIDAVFMFFKQVILDLVSEMKPEVPVTRVSVPCMYFMSFFSHLCESDSKWSLCVADYVYMTDIKCQMGLWGTLL